MTLADRIVVMRSGEIVAVGSPMEIYSNRSIFRCRFLGSPSMNLSPAKSSKRTGARSFVPRASRLPARTLQG